MSMYQGKKPFDREQLVFMVDVILTAALDRCEVGLPQSPSKADQDDFSSRSAEYYSDRTMILETAGFGLACLYAQITDDGIAGQDALEESGLEKVADKLAKTRTNKKWTGFKQGVPTMPDCRPLAEKFVDWHFKDYLRAKKK